MTDHDESLGCLPKIGYSLLALVIYLAFSVFFFCGSSAIIVNLKMTPWPPDNQFALPEPAALVIGFLLGGPLVVVLYMLFLRNSRGGSGRAVYGLLGIGIYLLCGTLAYFACNVIINQANLASGRSQSEVDRIFSMALAFSFLVIGPIMVVMYGLYLRDIGIIEVQDAVVPLRPRYDEKRKKI